MQVANFVKHRSRFWTRLALFLCALAASSLIARADDLSFTLFTPSNTTAYTQPSAGTSGTAEASQNDTGIAGLGNFVTTYDNFTLGSNTTIAAVGFTGAYFDTASPPTITGFDITFYTNNGGQPGTAILADNIGGNGGETATGQNDSAGNPTYNYLVNLGALGSFSATAGTTYWMSIVADLDVTQSQWGWETGTGGDGIAFQDSFGTRTELPPPSAPEPGSLLLLGAGLTAGVVRRFIGKK